MTEIVIQVARAEPGAGAVQELGIENWNDDGSANVVAVTTMTTTMPDPGRRSRPAVDGSSRRSGKGSSGSKRPDPGAVNDEEGASVGPAEVPTDRTRVGARRGGCWCSTRRFPRCSTRRFPRCRRAVPTVSAPKPPSALRQWFSRHGTPGGGRRGGCQLRRSRRLRRCHRRDLSRGACDGGHQAADRRDRDGRDHHVVELYAGGYGSLPDRSAKYLGGDFEEQYRRYVDAIAATNKQAKVSSTTRVVGAAVESLRGGATGADARDRLHEHHLDDSANPQLPPSMKYLSYRLDLKRFGRDWRVTKMTTITSLDLTPKL